MIFHVVNIYCINTIVRYLISMLIVTHFYVSSHKTVHVLALRNILIHYLAHFSYLLIIIPDGS